MSAIVSAGLEQTLRSLGAFDAQACMNCGVCTASCPLDLDVLPRRIFRYATLGLDDEVRACEEAIFSCLLCRACEENCPAGVNITENMRLLRRRLLEEEH